MTTTESVHLGLLSPATPNRPHFKHLDLILPPRVSLTNEDLDLLGESYQDLSGKSDVIIARALDFVRRNPVRGLILTGGFVTLFNLGLETQVSAAIGLPVASALSSAVAALKTFAAKSVLMMTPFDGKSNDALKAHLNGFGFEVLPGASFENRKPGAAIDLTREQLFSRVEQSFRANPGAQAIYFQGATLDPLPIMEKLEDHLKVPVIASNPAMLWNLLSRLGLKYSVPGYGKLLSSWPALP